MTDISGITNKISVTSKSHVSLEKIAPKKEIQISPEMQELKNLETEMLKAFALAEEIKTTLESALRNLSPGN